MLRLSSKPGKMKGLFPCDQQVSFTLCDHVGHDPLNIFARETKKNLYMSLKLFSLSVNLHIILVNFIINLNNYSL